MGGILIEMTCSACRQVSREWLCRSCLRSLATVPERVRGGVHVRSAFGHDGAARLLVHRLKYEAVSGIAERLAEVLEPLLPSDTTALVPVPRVWLRRWRYGIDPATALVTILSARVGLPVVQALRPRIWVQRRAGPAGGRRGVQSFRVRNAAPVGSILVDDVVTTGTTLRVAAGVAGCWRAVTVTASGTGS